jgi:tRNA(Arg) A34 adenosine deaminase TadA
VVHRPAAVDTVLQEPAMFSHPFSHRSSAPCGGTGSPGRRTAITGGLALLLGPSLTHAQRFTDADGARWYAAAAAMRSLAESWGDQPYGAVLVQGGRIVGHGPSRVVKNRDPDAHAEREALRDAIDRGGPDAARGAVLYSTSRPCAACERAAASAGVARLVFGAALVDGGVPVRP